MIEYKEGDLTKAIIEYMRENIAEYGTHAYDRYPEIKVAIDKIYKGKYQTNGKTYEGTFVRIGCEPITDGAIEHLVSREYFDYDRTTFEGSSVNIEDVGPITEDLQDCTDVCPSPSTLDQSKTPGLYYDPDYHEYLKDCPFEPEIYLDFDEATGAVDGYLDGDDLTLASDLVLYYNYFIREIPSAEIEI